MTQSPRRRASAALILGALSGALAAMTVLTTAIPVSRRLADTEDALGRRHAGAAADVASQLLTEDGTLPAGWTERLVVQHISVHSDEGAVLHEEGAPLNPVVLASACDDKTQTLHGPDGEVWAVGCTRTERGAVIAAWQPLFASTTEVLWLVFTLSALVGIVTAMGVLVFLRPLTNLSSALDRVSAGERGVRVAFTGLAEFDHLVERLNTAAQAMEEREDAIVARIQVVQQLARLVAHEVRNPLQSLELLASLIAVEDHPDERAELAQSIHHEVSTLNAVVQRLLSKDATSGALRLNLVTQNLSSTIDHVVSLRRPEATSRGTQIEKGTMSLTAIPYDPALLGRSIENLVINSMQVVPPRYGLIRISVEEEDEHMAIIVEDNGPGVDRDYGTQIFEPNVTTKETGTGLGLTLVKGVVEAHGGYIEYDDSPLGGARFVARIPKAEVTAAANATPSADRR